MNLAVVLFTLFAAWKWGDWKNYRKYLPTIYIISLGNMFYHFLYKESYLWMIVSPIVPDTITVILHSFVTMPLTVLIFLSNMPTGIKAKIFRIFKYISIYAIAEFVYLRFGYIAYNNGWTAWHSVAWNIMMFPTLLIHHKNPIYAYGIAVLVTITMLILFPVKM